MTEAALPAQDVPVNIVACGGVNGGVVYAVGVTQPVQSWTVVRTHDDFLALSKVLTQSSNLSVPSCPPLRSGAATSQAPMEEGRHELQRWLATVLFRHGVSESPAMRQFLTDGANTIPQQYDGIIWTTFATVSFHQAPSVASPVSANGGAAHGNSVDDMDMDYMFMGDDYGTQAQPQHYDDHHGAEEENIPSASERYKPTDEAVADEDEMDIMQYAGEVEMVDDVGSLAQSMGASHLGRSLKLQVERNIKKGKNDSTNQQQRPSGGGINLGAGAQRSTGTNESGISSAVANAMSSGDPTHGSTDIPHHRTNNSTPRLDSFKMIRVIGKGSFGKVFLVKENKSGEIYALKVLRKDNIIKRNQIEHTKTERSVLGYVKHPFIVGLNMAFQSKDKLYFVLDYCAGGELFFHLGKLGRFPEERAKFYAAEIVLAISYVHSLDIVYRDLKPENVLLDHRGHIRLTDFGLSKEGIISSSSGANSFCGTPEYLAPEILNRQGHGRAVDWWSLGALLYEMLTGLPPFYCQDRERLFEKIRRSELSYPSTVRPDAKTLLKGLLTKDPNTRLGSGPEDAEEIKRQLFFSSIEWDKLFRGEIEPPWVPSIQNRLDTSQFDKEFTNMPIFSPQSMQRGASGFGTTPAENPFEGFTFTDSKLCVGPAADWTG